MNILVFIFLLNAQNEIVSGNAVGVAPNIIACEAMAAAWVVKNGPPPDGQRVRHLCVRAVDAHE